MTSAFGRVRWSLRHRGVGGTLGAAARNLNRRLRPQPERPPHPFDVEHGTDTGGLLTGADLACGHPSDRFIEGYAAVPPSRFRNMLARWQAGKAVAGYTFVDLGCGKGRAVLLASELGFREVVGVELNPSLANMAQANTDRWRAAAKARCPIRIACGDAAEFTRPEGHCLVFLFNPFGPELIQRVARRMAEQFRERPSEIDVLYYKPEQAKALSEWFEPVWCETTAILQEDLDADPVASPQDQTCCYRLCG